MKGLFAWVGFRQAAVEYDRAERAAGTTKFNFWKLWNFALDGITSASHRAAAHLELCRRGDRAVRARATRWFIVGRTLLFGSRRARLRVAHGHRCCSSAAFSCSSLGILGEYVGRIFNEVKQRPLYVVRDTVGIKSQLVR